MLKERWIKMKDYGRVRSTINPKPMVIDEFSVWIHKNITEVSENVGEENEFIGYEYDMIQYEKDEYIELITEQGITRDNYLLDLDFRLYLVEMGVEL
jgi:hypothetical protein